MEAYNEVRPASRFERDRFSFLGQFCAEKIEAEYARTVEWLLDECKLRCHQGSCQKRAIRLALRLVNHWRGNQK